MYGNPQSRAERMSKNSVGRGAAGSSSVGRTRVCPSANSHSSSARNIIHFISQLETGRGRIPRDRYQIWADALKIPPKESYRTFCAFMTLSHMGYCSTLDYRL